MSGRRAPTWLAAALTAWLSGCASTPTSSFYALSETPADPGGAPFVHAVALGPVDMPAYLKRPQIVTRVGGNRLKVDEFNRWGSMLDDEFGRVLTQNLLAALGSGQVFGYPSRLVAETDFRVAIDVRRFDGELGGEVVLDVAWSIIDDRTGDLLAARRAAYREPSNGTDYAAYAAALSRLVARFGDALAVSLRTLEPPAPG